MPTASDAWKNNLQAKIAELRQLLLQFLTTKDVKVGNEAIVSLIGLMSMFAPSLVPHQLRGLQTQLGQLMGALNHMPYFLNVMQSYEALPAIASFDEQELPSFDKIFESYKADADLQSLIDELTELLQRILTEDDDKLSAQVARELSVILEQLKKRDKKSLYEVLTWVDLSARAILLTIEVKSGTHGLALLYEAAKTAFRIKRKVLDDYKGAQDKLMNQYNLVYVKRAVATIPDIHSEVEVIRYLKEPPPEPDGQ